VLAGEAARRAARSFYDKDAPIYTMSRFLPPSKVQDAEVTNSVLGDGCVIRAGTSITHSVIGLRSLIGERCKARPRAILRGLRGRAVAPGRGRSARKPSAACGPAPASLSQATSLFRAACVVEPEERSFKEAACQVGSPAHCWTSSSAGVPGGGFSKCDSRGQPSGRGPARAAGGGRADDGRGLL